MKNRITQEQLREPRLPWLRDWQVYAGIFWGVLILVAVVVILAGHSAASPPAGPYPYPTPAAPGTPPQSPHAGLPGSEGISR